MSKYLDPKNDLTFKRVFSEHKHLCKSLLSNLLLLDDNKKSKRAKIVELEYLSTEMIPLLEISKHSVVGVRCTDDSGRQFIVEMQMIWSKSFKFRTLMNAAKAFVKQLDSAAKYSQLKPVYSLCLINDIVYPKKEDEDEYYHHFDLSDSKDNKKKIEGFDFVVVELPKFKPTNDKEKEMFDLWLKFLTQISTATDEIPAELLNNKDIADALHYLEERAYTKAELDAYWSVRDAQMIDGAIFDDALEIGFERGMGILAGVVQGKAEGEKIGEENAIKKLISRLKNQGKTKEEISEILGISAEGI